MSYSSSFGILPKLILYHLPLVFFQFLLYLAIYLLNLLPVSCALSLDSFGCQQWSTGN